MRQKIIKHIIIKINYSQGIFLIIHLRNQHLTHTLSTGPGLGHRQETPWLCLQEITVEEAKDYSLVEPVPREMRVT